MVGVVVRRPGGAGDVDAGGTPSSGHGDICVWSLSRGSSLLPAAWRRSSRSAWYFSVREARRWGPKF